MTDQVVQGDILLVPAMPPSSCAAKDGPVIVGYGEASGHQHVMVGDCQWLVEATADIDADLRLRRFANGEDIGRPVFVQVGEGVQLAHLDGGGRPTADHAAIDVPPGVYRVIRQRQWTAGMARAVAD